jgi:hypothetical protein
MALLQSVYVIISLLRHRRDLSALLGDIRGACSSHAEICAWETMGAFSEPRLPHSPQKIREQFYKSLRCVCESLRMMDSYTESEWGMILETSLKASCRRTRLAELSQYLPQEN